MAEQIPVRKETAASTEEVPFICLWFSKTYVATRRRFEQVAHDLTELAHRGNHSEPRR